MNRFYEPNLTADVDSPFLRDAANKLVRRTYWLDMNDRIKLAPNLGAPGAPELPCRLSGRLESSCSIFGCHGDGCLNVRQTASSRSCQHRGSCGLLVWKLTAGVHELLPTRQLDG